MPTWPQIWPNSNEEKTRLSFTPKQDGFIAWCICLSAFLSNAVIIGIDCSFGESIGSIRRDFNVNSGDAAWIGSIHSSIQFYAAFAASFLVKFLGFGPTILFGTLLGFISFGAALFSPNLISLVASYGIVSGLGLGLAYNPANVICAFYFKKYRPLAVALANAGSGFGIIIIAYFLNLMNKNYDWKGSVLLCTMVTPLISLLGSIVWLFPMQNEKEDKNRTIGTENNNLPISTEITSLIKHDLMIQDIEHSKTKCYNENQFLKKHQHFSILKTSTIYIYCLAQSITLLAFYVPLDFLPGMMTHVHKISEIDAGNIVTIIGIGRTAGGIALGVVINFLDFKSLFICSFTYISLGCRCIGYIISYSYTTFACLSFVNGILHGFTYIIIPLTLLELFGLDSIIDAYGLVMFSSGMSVSFGLPLIGYLIHDLKSYDEAFIVAGGPFFLSGVLSIFLLFNHVNPNDSK